MNQQQGFDGKLLITIVLTFIVFVGYQAYLKQKYPDMDKPKTAETMSASEGGTQLTDSNTGTTTKSDSTSAPESNLKVIEEKTVVFDDDKWTVVFTSKGMAVKEITLKEHTTREGDNIQFKPSAGGNFSTNLVGRRTDLMFELEKTSPVQIVGRAYDGTTKISKTVTLDSEKNVFETLVRVENAADNFLGLTTELNKDIVAMNSGFSLIPSFENQEVFYMQDEESEHEILGGDESRKELFEKSPVAGLTTQYFAVAMTDKSQVIPELLWTYIPKGEGAGTARTLWTHNMLTKTADFSVRYIGYAGPKAYDHLHDVDEALAGIVNFGFFNTLAVMLYHLLQFIFDFVGNWGVAIIIMTAIFRLVVLPLNLMSYKSMKVMSTIQPQVKEIQKKYADDRERANQEVMKLMKDKGANPLGGCLPMLLQIPIFFALYQVLGQSIELYKAPFILWITDLSAKDPYFVIPVLMTATMFAQQKLTPSTMEPAQQKMMMFMLLGFSIFFIALPAGLTLYMFISTLFGVLQQVYFLRDKKAEATA